MRLTLHTVDGDFVEVEDFDAVSALDLVDELKDPDGPAFLTLELDGEDTVMVARRHVVRIDLDHSA